jgi:hypothetical protein
MVAIPVNDPGRQLQTAQIIPMPVLLPPPPVIVEPVEVKEEPVTLYYIVIASLPTAAAAEIQVERFRKEGFSNLGIIGDGNKRRVYLATFDDRTDANAFLVRFRAEHPRLKDAWLLVQRTRKRLS